MNKGGDLGRPPVQPKTELASRILRAREAVTGDDREKFAALSGISASTIGNYERGDRVPDAEMIRKYLDVSGVSAVWLITGKGEMFGRDSVGVHRNPTGDLTDLDQPGMISIPRYDEVRPSAGPGSVAVSEVPTTRVAFERHWLIDIGVSPTDAVILPAQGDSMSPTIPNGAPMLVDTSKTEIRSGYIYVIAVGEDLLVKRVRRRLDGLFDLISDNAAYASETLGPDRLMQLRVIGRVYASVSKF